MAENGTETNYPFRPNPLAIVGIHPKPAFSGRCRKSSYGLSSWYTYQNSVRDLFFLVSHNFKGYVLHNVFRILLAHQAQDKKREPRKVADLISMVLFYRQEIQIETNLNYRIENIIVSTIYENTIISPTQQLPFPAHLHANP